MNYNIEWLFEEVYKIRRDSDDKIHFISDWDVNGEELIDFKNLLAQVYKDANNSSLKYNYAYEQFSLKEQIIQTANKDNILDIEELNITITPSATISIYLTAQSLMKLGAKRILIITPAYFSTHEAFENAGCSIFYYHLKDEENLSINFIELETLIKEQYIDGIVLTDPIYSAGIELSLNDYSELVKICTNNDTYLIVDYSLGGLKWIDNGDFVLNKDKVSILKRCNKFVFIDTLSKRLLLNGIKFSIIIGDENIIDKIDLISEVVYGGLSSAQCFLIRELYKPENRSIVNTLCEKNIQTAIESHNLIKSTLIGTDFSIENTNCGYFSLINHKTLQIESIDTKSFSLNLLNEHRILCITKDRFTYFPRNRFGFRVNLNKKSNELLFPISQCVGIDYSRFQKR